MYLIILFVLIIFSFNPINAGESTSSATGNQNFLQIANLDQCEGKDALNYTVIRQVTTDPYCSANSGTLTSPYYLIACPGNGPKTVIDIQKLVGQLQDDGANLQADSLGLALNGNLAGKYVFSRVNWPRFEYLRKCSSILGRSYVQSKTFIVLIADKLDLNCFLNPDGCFDVFKKSASTICKGVLTEF